MRRLLAYFRSLPDRQMVRPWALAVPILVLLIAAPMLRPLRHPLPTEISRDEVTRLATVQAIVEHGTTSIEQAGLEYTPYGFPQDDTDGIRQPPMLAALLSPTYWVLHRSGATMDEEPELVAYVLTLVGVTVPVALAGGLIYRMGRLFELRRKWRTLLAGVVVFGSGLFSYATVLNPHAPAAALVIGGAACLVHVAMVGRSYANWLWLTICGLCLTLAGTIDPPALIFLPLMACVILAMRWRMRYRALGVACYVAGALLPLVGHVLLSDTFVEDFLPARMRGDEPVRVLPPGAGLDPLALVDVEPERTVGAVIRRNVADLFSAMVGSHGLLSHFPVLIMGLLGIAAVMHRHWAVSTKVFATATAGAALIIIIGCVIWLVDWGDAAFAVRWFIVFTPLLLFWCGAWLRKSHRPATWGLVGALAVFSIGVTLIGATYPLPRNGYFGYTAAAALRAIGADHSPTPGLLAGAAR